MKRTAFIVSTILFVTLPVLAATGTPTPHWQGSIPVTGKHSEDELAALAKVTKADAQKTALAAVKAKDKDKRVTEAELEVEDGYLIWSFDIKVTGKNGITEVLVDAGNGKVLATEHEKNAPEPDHEKEGGEK